MPPSVLPVCDSPDIAVISEHDDREDRVDSPTSIDLVPSQRIQLATNNVSDSSPSPLSDTVAISAWGYEEPASSCELERDFREHMRNIPNYHMVWNNFREALTISYQRRRSIVVWMKFIDTILDMKVEIYHQTMISPRDQFLINCSMLLDDSKTIMQYGLSPYSIIHLHIRLRGGMPNYLDIPATFDLDDISTIDNGHFSTKH